MFQIYQQIYVQDLQTHPVPPEEEFQGAIPIIPQERQVYHLCGWVLGSKIIKANLL